MKKLSRKEQEAGHTGESFKRLFHRSYVMNVSNHEWKQLCLTLMGAVAGGVLGYFTFLFFVHHGLYGMIVPGGFIGLGAGLGRTRYVAAAVVCALAALSLSIYCEWRMFPFIVDHSFEYFLKNLVKVDPVHLLMMAGGTALAFWVPFRRRLR